MLSKVFAAAAVAVVSAADVPVFSSNDDYDEINLNIRMLQNTTSTGTTAPVATSISGDCSLTQTGANTCDATYTAAHEASVNAVVAGTYGASVSDSSTTATCSRRLSAAGRRLQAYTDSTTPYTQAYTYTVTFPSQAAADAAVASYSAATMNTALGAATLNGAAVTGATSTSPTVVAAPGGSPASPSPSPSSNAAKVAVSTLAAFSAFMASMM